MKGVLVTAWMPFERLQLCEVPRPLLGPRQVRIHINFQRARSCYSSRIQSHSIVKVCCEFFIHNQYHYLLCILAGYGFYISLVFCGDEAAFVKVPLPIHAESARKNDQPTGIYF